MALVRWDWLARPNMKGGWGFKNTFYFSKSLVLKILCKVMVGTSF